MQGIMINETAAVTTSGITAGLLQQFIEYIDRGQQTTRTYITNLRQFAAWLQFSEIKTPGRKDIVSYRDYLTAEHEAIEYDAERGWKYRTKNGKRITVICKPNTAAQYLRSVCQFFRWTAANGIYPNIAENIHAPKVRHDTHKKDSLTAADVMRIEDSIQATAGARMAAAEQSIKDTAGRAERATEQGKRLYAMFLLAVNAGLRTIELSRANVKDIELINGTAFIWIYGKGHTEADRKKPLAPAVYDALQEYLDSRTDNYTQSSPLFVSTGNRSRGQRIAPTTISTMLKRAMQAAGYDSERLTAHSLRHTAGQNVMEVTGSNIYLTQQYMRHSNPATTEIYLENNTITEEADIAARLYDHYHGIETEGSRAKLENIMDRLNPAQLEQLANIAAAMA